MNVFVVHYQYDEWEDNEWNFVGIFTTESQAKTWVEQQITAPVWRDALGGEMRGIQGEGLPNRKYRPNRFNVMPVGIDSLIDREM